MTRSVYASLVALSILCALLVPAPGRDWRGGRTRTASRPASRPASGPASRPAVYPFPPPAKRPAPSTSPAGEVCRAALDWLERAEPTVDRLVPLAGQVADRVLAGGTVYVGGNGGFADEYDYRAGGFPFTVIWTGQRLHEQDVLLVGSFRPNEMDNPRARIDYLVRGYGQRLGGVLAVHLGGHAWPQVQRSVRMTNGRAWDGRLHLVDTGGPHGAAMSDLCVGQLSATALGWVVHGEVIAAATRRGKTLATYASDWEPNGRQWDASVRGKHLHPKYTVPPLPAGGIGRQYLKTCREQVGRFAATQLGAVRLAGRRLAACMRRGGVVWVVTDSHILPRAAAVPRELSRLKMFGRSYDWGYFSRQLPKGDMVLWLGYLRYPTWAVRAARQRGCEVVVAVVDDGPTDENLTHIRSCWKDFDTVIDLPGYPIRVLPTSGILHTVQWYALMAETVAAMEEARRDAGDAGDTEKGRSP